MFTRRQRRLIAAVPALGLLLALLLSSLTVPVLAQEDSGLSEEEQATLARVVAAAQRLDGEISYVLAVEENQSLTIQFNLPGQSLTVGQTEHYTLNGYVVAGEGDGPDAMSATATLGASEEGPEGELSYSVETDIRAVEGAVYINATGTSNLPDFDPVSQTGWQVYTSADQLPETYAILELEDWLADSGDTINPTRGDLLNDMDFLTRILEAVTVEEGELDDGTPVETITLAVSEAGFAELLREAGEIDDTTEQNPIVQVMLGETAQHDVTFVVQLDASGNLIHQTLRLDIEASEVDMGALSPENFPPNTLISLQLSVETIIDRSDFGADFEPVTAPEDVADPDQQPEG